MLTEQQINEYLQKFFNKPCANCENISFNCYRRILTDVEIGSDEASDNDIIYIAKVCTKCGLTNLINEWHLTHYFDKKEQL